MMEEELANIAAFAEEGKAAEASAADSLDAEGDNVKVDLEDGAPNRFSPSIPKLPKVKVPTGGVGLLVMLCLLIVFAISKAPGQDVSRLKLIGMALLGTATLGDGGGSLSTIPTPGEQWATGSPLPAIGNTRSGQIGNQWGGGFY